jgi:hypothetical protein
MHQGQGVDHTRMGTPHPLPVDLIRVALGIPDEIRNVDKSGRGAWLQGVRTDVIQHVLMGEGPKTTTVNEKLAR